MTDITDTLSKFFEPKKGLVIYQTPSKKETFVEAFDFSKDGSMINAHPLSNAEMKSLASSLQNTPSLSVSYAQPDGLLPKNILYISSGNEPYVIWHTLKTVRHCLFVEGLKIADGNYPVPPMLWKADRDTLTVYALSGNRRPTLHTPLFRAPFFNIHPDGRVCMGTVNIDINESGCLEDFISQWESYFFNSRFSHTLGGSSPVKGNIIQLWQHLHNTTDIFPVCSLTKQNINLKELINGSR